MEFIFRSFILATKSYCDRELLLSYRVNLTEDDYVHVSDHVRVIGVCKNCYYSSCMVVYDVPEKFKFVILKMSEIFSSVWISKFNFFPNFEFNKFPANWVLSRMSWQLGFGILKIRTVYSVFTYLSRNNSCFLTNAIVFYAARFYDKNIKFSFLFLILTC